MNHLFLYLVQVNLGLMILFVSYKIFFEKDKNFMLRRIYLLGILTLPFLIPHLPRILRDTMSGMMPLSFPLREITVTGQPAANIGAASVPYQEILAGLYFTVLFLGLLKLSVQLTGILRAAGRSERVQAGNITLLASKRLHASSFFSFIFIDPSKAGEDSFEHILEHERIHKKGWHSVDRILTELFVLVNWFNPVAWMVRRSVIENLEYIADSAVIDSGTDPFKYQLSILHQYIGSASIANQFSHQIKNRITMLHKDYKMGSGWKLTLLVPLVLLALAVVSCTENNEMRDASHLDDEVFYVVEEMPKFRGEDPATGFRKYIAQNLRYPKEAARAGVAGRVIVQFVVSSEGKVIIPSREDLSRITGKPLEEVVVVAYAPIEKEGRQPEERFIEMFKDEVIRVVSSSPEWEPGRQRGREVNVMFTFPVNFVLQ